MLLHVFLSVLLSPFFLVESPTSSRPFFLYIISVPSAVSHPSPFTCPYLSQSIFHVPPTRIAIFEHTLSHLLSTNWLCVSYNLQDQQEDNPFLQVASLNLLSVSFKLWSHLWIILLPFISFSSQSVAASECNLGLRNIFHFHALFHIYNQCSLSFHSSMTVSKMMVHATCLLQLYYTELQDK